MAEYRPIIFAALAGFLFGNAFCWLPGPINLTILNEGARRGFRWAFLIGLGAACMDVVYCAISFTGFSQFFDNGMVKASMQVGSFVFLLLLGFKFLMAPTVNVHTKLDDASERIEAQIEKKIHPRSPFATGFLRVAANLGVLAAWLVLAATLMSHDWVDDSRRARIACVGGVFVGTVLWFLFLSFAVSRGHGKFSEQTLLRLQHISGLCLLATAIFEGAQIAWHLSQHKF
jgi:threonine/homoserine/homoserine lactone efflux protein